MCNSDGENDISLVTPGQLNLSAESDDHVSDTEDDLFSDLENRALNALLESDIPEHDSDENGSDVDDEYDMITPGQRVNNHSDVDSNSGSDSD